jgi:gliding motility-associated-like protein
VVFNWTGVTGASGYTVSYQINANPIVVVGPIGNLLTYSVSGLTPGDSVTITLTPTGGAGTCFASSSASCTANNCNPPTASISYAGNPFCSSDATVQSVTLVGTGLFTGGVYSSTLGLSLNATSGEIIASTSTPGPYTITYTIAATAGCSPVVATTAIVINAPPIAGVDGSTAVCESSLASIDLFSLITGEQAGGVWTRTSGTGGTFNAGAGTFVPALGATTSTFTYTVSGVAPCANDSSLANITINPQANAGVDGSVTVCDSSIASIDLFSLITGEQAGGVWTRTSGAGGTFNAASGTFVPAVGASSSTFTYTVSGVAPCANDTSLATITINPQANAGADGSVAICESSITSIDLFSLITGEQAGGVWTRTSGLGGTFNSAAGTFVPAVGASSSTFTYTVSGVAPCANDSSLATITINPQANAGVDGSVTVCDSSIASIDLFSLITGEQAGGVWTRTSGAGGTFNAASGTFVPAVGASSSTFTYTVSGVAPCTNDTSLATISIIAQPNAGSDGSTIICESSIAIVDLFSLISGEQAGGVWTRSSGAGGTFNASTGTFVPVVGASSSTFTYTVSGVAPCLNDTSLASITINPQPNAGADGNVTVCDSSVASLNLFSLITGEQTGGVWTRTSGSGGTFNATAGTFVPALGASSSTFTYTLTGAAPCVNDTSIATITINPQSNAGVDGSTSVCETNTASINLFSLITGEQTGGVWTRTSGTGGTFSATSGTFIPAVGATTSTFIYTLNGVAPCIVDSSMATVTITAQPIAGTLSGIQTVCQGNTRNFSPTIPGGTWTSTNPLVATVTPLTGIVVGISPGIATITYTILGTGGCPNATVDRQITVTPTPQLTNSGINIICSNETSNVLLTATASGTNFTWTVSQSGVTGATSGSGNSINQTLSSTNGGNAIYTVTPSLNGCIGNAAYVAVNVRPLPKPTLSNGAICIELATGTAAQPFVFNSGLGDSSHDFQWFFEGTTILGETSTTLAASEAGEYSVIATNTATGCISNEVFGTMTSSIIADSFTTTVTDAFEDYPYIIVNTPSGTGPFQYQLDSGAFQNSNVFYNVPSGFHTINVKDNEGCTDLNGVVYILNYPHFFTPNGDTYNDTWNIWDLEDQEVVSIFIFDRYGKFIKEISPRGTGWDGTMNGYELPATDYWFTVDYFDPNTKTSNTFKSHFSLKR